MAGADTVSDDGSPGCLMPSGVGVRSGEWRVAVTYYTDPLCSWSWALEPQWRRLRYEFGDQLTWRYRMGGMIADWHSFNDPLNSVSKPVQMGPNWFQVRVVSGMPINERLWHEDPPDSSYPACLAFKAAEQQGPTVAERYLRRLREAVMLERRNIARRDVLLALAAECAGADAGEGGLDYARFTRDLAEPRTLDAFRDDLKDVRYHTIGRFPSLTLQQQDGTGVIIVGYRPYPMMREALAHLAPDLAPARAATDIAAYVSAWGSLTAREIAEAFDWDTARAEQALNEAASRGEIRCVMHPTATAAYYRVADNRGR